VSRTNIVIDDKLVAETMKRTRCKTKREVVDLALKELLAREKLRDLLKLRGSRCWEGDLDEMRRSRV